MGGGWKLIVNLILSVISQLDGFVEFSLLPDKGNIWEYLVRKILNISDFYLAGGKSVKIF